MKREALFIGQFVFPTKAAAVKAIRAIANGAILGEPLAGAEKELILALLERHRDPKRKIGAGIERVCVRINDYNQRGFYLRRVGESADDDFSWTQCISPPRPIDRVRTALRRTVQGQVDQARVRHFGSAAVATCELTGRPITFATSHVHHETPTFAALVDEFLTAEGIRADEVELAAAANVEGAHLAVEWHAFGDRFAAFHATRARLLVVHESDHLRLPRP
jgi:hypothetical protein